MINKDYKENKNSITYRQTAEVPEEVSEKLKKVDIIFSEQKGILTKEIMEVSKIFVGGKIYGGFLEQNKEKLKYHVNGDNRPYELLNTLDANYDCDYAELLNKNTERSKLIEFLLISSICHNANAKTDALTGDITYEGSLVLDMPLISAAKEMGFVFTKRTVNSIEVKNEHTQKTEIWEILFFIPFDSCRKRTSIFVKIRECEKNLVYVFSKGNHSVIMPICKLIDDSAFSTAVNAVDKFTLEGMRTGVLAMKLMEYQEFSKWHLNIQAAQQIENDDLKYEKLNQLYNEMENNFHFSGAYGLEETLQDGVSETIQSFLKSGKKFWIITANTKDACLSAAKKCGFLNEKEPNEIIDLNESNTKAIEIRLDSIVKDLNAFKLNDFNQMKTIQTKRSYYLLINGSSLNLIFQSEELSLKFLKIAILCRSVFGYRLAPKEKMNIMKLTKNLTKLVTMSIGSGGSDVPMMLCSDIRVCLEDSYQGIENDVADFTIKNFRNLQDLFI